MYHKSKGGIVMFNNNETVCFLGDSITTHGHFVKEVFQFLVDNHKEDKVKIYNCGVPGDAACRTVERLYEDCLILNPTTVVLMLGVNDIERALYIPNKEIENVEEKREYFLELYRVNMRKIIEDCMEMNAKVILCTPTPIDDKKCIAQGCNVPLGKCIDFLKEIAAEKKLQFVDYNTVMLNMMDREIFNADGAHPSEYGHHVMAQVLLKELGYIKECDFETMPVYSEKNQERFNAEQVYRDIKMLEWCSMYDFNKANPDASYQEKIELAKQKRQDALNSNKDWLVNITNNYIKYLHQLPKLQGDVIKKTIKMYD